MSATAEPADVPAPRPALPGPWPRIRISVCSLLILLGAAVFGVTFTILSLHNLYLHGMASEYRLAARQLQADQRLRAAAPAPAALNPVVRTLMQIARSSVPAHADPPQVVARVLDLRSRTLSHSALPASTAVTAVPARVKLQLAHLRQIDAEMVPQWEYLTAAEGLFIILPVTGPERHIERFILLTVAPDASTDLANAFSLGLARDGARILAAGALVLVILLACLQQASVQVNPRRRRLLMAALFTLLVAIQGVVAALGLQAFNDKYAGISNTKAQVILNLIKADIEPYLALGIRIDLFADMDAYLENWISMHAELSGLEIRQHRGGLLFAADDHNPDAWTSTSIGDLLSRRFRPWQLRLETTRQATLETPAGPVATVHARFSEQALYRQLYDTFISGLTIIVIAALVALEVLTLVSQNMARLVDPEQSRNSRYLIMRPAMFFFLFGIDISMSFVPLQMEQVYTPLWGLSREVIIGLPVSAEFLAVGVAILFAGIWSDRRGWQEPFLGGVLLAAAGMYYSYLAESALGFIAARGIVGIGFGLVLLAAQSYVVANTGEKNKTLGLAHMFAGLYAGSICGSAVGAMLADWFDFATVFIIGCLLLLAVFVFAVVFMAPQTRHPAPGTSPGAPRRLTRQRLVRFMGDRRVVAVTLLCSLPAAVAVVGFLNYFSPVYLERLGSSQTTIGQVLMIYGLSLVILGPFVGRLIDSFADKRYAMLIGIVFGGSAFLVFIFLSGLGAVLVGMLLLGLSSSFVLASQSAYLLSIDAARAIGDGLAMAIFRSSSRIGQVLGPTVFALFVGVATNVYGIVYFGAAYLILGVLFMYFSRPQSLGLWSPGFYRGIRAFPDAAP